MSAPTDSPAWHVVCLCAAWCGVCREWMPVFRELAGTHPQWRFAWIDVEDEDEAMGEVDIETFPSVLIAQGTHARFLGPVPPSASGLAQLVRRLQEQPAAGISAEADALLLRLRPLLAGAAM